MGFLSGFLFYDAICAGKTIWYGLDRILYAKIDFTDEGV
jgi:tRNA(Arg) A34 adenosine deaminase TadA